MILTMMPHVGPGIPTIWNSHLAPTHRKRGIKRGKPVSIKHNLSLVGSSYWYRRLHN